MACMAGQIYEDKMSDLYDYSHKSRANNEIRFTRNMRSRGWDKHYRTTVDFIKLSACGGENP